MADSPVEGRGKRARDEDGSSDSEAASSSSSSSSPSSSSSAAASAAPPAPAPAPVARSLHLELQADPLARLFLSIADIIVAHKQGHFALDCWRLQDVSRETRFVAGVTQLGTVADLIRGGLASSGVGVMLREARACKRNEHGDTQLIRASWGNDVERVRQLFRLGCPYINTQKWWGVTALYYASLNGNESIVRELLAQGADVNMMDSQSNTPLRVASYLGQLAVVRLLRDAPGADLAGRSAIGLGALRPRSAGPFAATTLTSRPSCARAARPSESLFAPCTPSRSATQ